MIRDLLTIACLSMLMLTEGGCESGACREQYLITPNINGRSGCSSPAARIEVTQYQVICRCPPFAPPSGSAKP